METTEIRNIIEVFRNDSGWNRISPEKALRSDLAGMEMFSPALVGIAAADDPAFLLLKREGAVGPQFLLPGEWLPGARSVVSFFLPFTAGVREANAESGPEPAPEWLHGRIEGQEFIDRLSRALVEHLCEEGGDAVAPAADPRFASCTLRNTVFRDGAGAPFPVTFTSNWSERHVAFVCGLGTFGLSKGLITSRGVAGRFGSVITTLVLTPDNVIPEELYGNCTLCGECAVRCPAGAISPGKGKDHVLCSEYLDLMKKKHSPRYGCGKCQTGVPCEKEIPAKKTEKARTAGKA
jgi:epoxyqueuosine reductase QueG